MMSVERAPEDGGREVLSALSRLDEEVASLEKAVEDARGRLGPVLTPDEPTKDGAGAEPASTLSARSPVAGATLEAADRVAASTRALYWLLNRLEV